MIYKKIFGTVLGISFLLILLAFFFGYQEYRELQDKYQKILEENDSKVQQNRNFQCVKIDTTYPLYQLYEINHFQVDTDGEVVSSETQYVYAYQKKEDYELSKTNEFLDDKVEFDDKNLKVIKKDQLEHLENVDGEILHLWVKDYLKTYESNHYQCQEIPDNE